MIGAIGFLMVSIIETRKGEILGIAFCGIALAAGITGHHKGYLSVQEKNHTELMPLAMQIRETTPKDAVNIYVGFDWDSTIPYYSERRALMIADWTNLKLTAQDVRKAFQNVRNEKIGSIFIARPSRWSKEFIVDLLMETGMPTNRIYSLN